MNALELHQRFRRYCAVEEGLSVSTVKAMDSAFRTFLTRTEVESVTQITPELLQAFFYEGRERHQWSYWHFVNHHKYLKKFLDWCIAQGLLQTNPIVGMRKPKKPQSLPRRLSFEEGQRVLYASFNHDWRYMFERVRNHAMIATFLFTGLRAAELINLQTPDVDTEGGVLLVRCGKGGKDRYVPIHPKLRYMLKRYLNDRTRLRKTSPYLFTGALSDRKLSYKDVSRICKKVSASSGVKFTPHCLRHTFGSVAIEQDMGLVQLKEVMGHSNISSTMIYLRMSTRGLKDSINLDFARPVSWRRSDHV